MSHQNNIAERIILHAPPYIYTLIVVLAICYLTLAPDPLPDYHISLIPYADKIAHFLMFGGLAVVLCFDYGRRRGDYSSLRLTPLAVTVCALTASLGGGIVELLQRDMDMGRSADWFDFIADVLGAFVCATVFAWLVSVSPWAYRTSRLRLQKAAPDSLELKECLRLYRESFPECERRPWSGILDLMADRKSPFTFNLIESRGKCAGFVTTWTFPDFVYIEHFAVRPELRGRGVGSRVLSLMKKGSALPLVLEAEPAETGSMAAKRIEFYRRNGFHLFAGYLYMQPAYACGYPEVELKLMSTSSALHPEDIARILHTKVYGADYCREGDE